MIKLKIKAFAKLIALLFNSYVIGSYTIIFENQEIDNIVLMHKRIKIKKKVSQKDLKEYLNECYKNSR